MENSIFRKKTMDRISSPEKLTDYLKVTTPGIWILLSCIVLILGGIIAWGFVGTIETTEDAKVSVTNGKARIVVEQNSEELSSGLTIHIASEDYVVSNVSDDAFGRKMAEAEVDLPDGTYEGEIVIETIHPIQFLFESR